MLKHGGKLLIAAKEENIPVGDWLDLSTGISPYPYPVPSIPTGVWHRLPEAEDSLLDVAILIRMRGAPVSLYADVRLESISLPSNTIRG